MGVLIYLGTFFNDSLMILIKKVLLKFKIQLSKEDIDVDEELGTYFECLGKFNRECWRLEELNLRKNLSI